MKELKQFSGEGVNPPPHISPPPICNTSKLHYPWVRPRSENAGYAYGGCYAHYLHPYDLRRYS